MADTKTLGAGERKSLEAINPLIVSDGWNGDTARNVRCALEFLADAVPAVELDSGFSKETAHGLNILLRACAAAVEVCHD